MDVTPENTTATVAPEATPAPVSAISAECFNSAAIVSVIKGYVKYLLKNNAAASKEELLAKVNPITSAALDRGFIATGQLELVNEWINSLPEFFEATRKETALKHSMKCVFKVASFCSNIDDPDIKRLQEIHAECHALCDKLAAKYGDIIKAAAQKFVNEFSGAFEPGFVEEVSKLFN